jgi:putative Holliday junction resolvase
MRIMGLDFGTKTVGVAISDPLLITAQGKEIIRRDKPSKLRQTLARIEELVQSEEVSEIVLGYPKNMNNTVGPKGELSLEFQKKLEGVLSVPVVLQDERLTTKSAHDMLIEGNVSRKNRKKVVDSVAAAIILQSYLDRRDEK